MNEVLIRFDEMPELEQSFEPCGTAWIESASLADLLATRDQIMLELERRKSAHN